MRFYDYFRKGLLRNPDRPILVDGDIVITHRDADHMSLRIASALHRSGISVGMKAALLSPNHALAFACVLGITRAGVLWSPSNVRNAPELNIAYYKFLEPDCLFYHSSLESVVSDMLAALPTVKLAVCIDAKSESGVSLESFMDRSDGVVPDVPDDPDRIVSLFPTGGTTGIPKGVLHSQKVWDYAVSAFWTTMGIADQPIHLAAAPLSHAAGGLAMMMLPSGATNVVLRKAEPLAILEAIEQYRVTHLYLPPTLLYMLLAHEDVRKFDYSSLTHFTLAAAPVAPEKLREALDVFGPVMCQSYGQTEVPQIATFLSTRDLLEAQADKKSNSHGLFASCGKATFGVRVEIMDDDGNILPAGDRGEIVMKGGLVFPGYYNNPKQNEETFRFGWHHSGDIGYMDERGYFYVVDRKKDMIISGGFNVYSAEVEAVILSHAAVRDCAVIGVPDPKWGEAIKAVIELKPQQTVTADVIKQMVKAKLGGVHTPKTVDFWSELPRHPNGKVLKREIRDRFWKDKERLVG